jgi:ligand-binding SRPBCC domain-containing protein
MFPGDHILTTETFIPRPCGEVFAFFAAAENLEKITPAELNFRIVSPLPIAMAAGALIDYRLRLFGISFSWQTLISRWEPGRCFVDEQLRGPYAKWVHTHTFTEVDGGTLVTDVVSYRLPLFPLGQLAYPLVRLQLKRIFAHRAQRIGELLGGTGSIVSC